MRTVTYTTTVNHRRPPAHQTVRPRVHGSRPPRRVVQRLDRDKEVSESRMTWATSMSILVFLGLSVLDLGPMYATDVRRQTDVRRALSLNAPAP